jgi:hypothetical protein
MTDTLLVCSPGTLLLLKCRGKSGTPPLFIVRIVGLLRLRDFQTTWQETKLVASFTATGVMPVVPHVLREYGPEPLLGW